MNDGSVVSIVVEKSGYGSCDPAFSGQDAAKPDARPIYRGEPLKWKQAPDPKGKMSLSLGVGKNLSKRVAR